MIFTFYSYKGGVGRSMALANIAEMLYERGSSVLMIDWDLDSPGLETYFPEISPKARENFGLLDMLLSYQDIVSRQAPPREGERLQFGDLKDYVVDVYQDEGRFLKLLSAGKRDGISFDRYANEIRLFNWKDFYQTWGGELYFEWFRREIENFAPIILIDSRNGVNEMSLICTLQLADVVVAFTSSNYQSIEGTEKIAEKLKFPDLQKLRPNRSRLDIVVVPARVETGELVARNKFESQFKNKFDYLLPINWKVDNRSFWDLKIPYVPLYAFEELVAVREKRLNGRRIAQELVEAYEKIWNAMVAKASKPGEEPWRRRKQTGKIVIVEDAEQWQKLLKEIVTTTVGEESYELATNQESAKSMLKEHDYKLIILNLNLASGALNNIIEYEGLEILDFLQATGREIPVLVLTSETIVTRNIYSRYPNVTDFFFKGSGEKGLAKNLSESIRKNLAI